jgi:hypothetical protein
MPRHPSRAASPTLITTGPCKPKVSADGVSDPLQPPAESPQYPRIGTYKLDPRDARVDETHPGHRAPRRLERRTRSGPPEGRIVLAHHDDRSTPQTPSSTAERPHTREALRLRRTSGFNYDPRVSTGRSLRRSPTLFLVAATTLQPGAMVTRGAQTGWVSPDDPERSSREPDEHRLSIPDHCQIFVRTHVRPGPRCRSPKGLSCTGLEDDFDPLQSARARRRLRAGSGCGRPGRQEGTATPAWLQTSRTNCI